MIGQGSHLTNGCKGRPWVLGHICLIRRKGKPNKIQPDSMSAFFLFLFHPLCSCCAYCHPAHVPPPRPLPWPSPITPLTPVVTPSWVPHAPTSPRGAQEILEPRLRSLPCWDILAPILIRVKTKPLRMPQGATLPLPLTSAHLTRQRALQLLGSPGGTTWAFILTLPSTWSPHPPPTPPDLCSQVTFPRPSLTSVADTAPALPTVPCSRHIFFLTYCNLTFYFISFKNIFLFIWLCQVLVIAYGIFSCSMWNLVP